MENYSVRSLVEGKSFFVFLFTFFFNLCFFSVGWGGPRLIHSYGGGNNIVIVIVGGVPLESPPPPLLNLRDYRHSPFWLVFFELTHFCSMVHKAAPIFVHATIFWFCLTFCLNVCKVVYQYFFLNNFQFCLHITLNMHEGLIMLRLMFNEIFNKLWGYYIIFPKFCWSSFSCFEL